MKKGRCGHGAGLASGCPASQVAKFRAFSAFREAGHTCYDVHGPSEPRMSDAGCLQQADNDGWFVYAYRRFRARMKGRVSGPTLYRGFQSQCRCLLQTYEASTISHSDLKSQDGNQSIPRLVVFMPSSLFLLFLLSPSSVSS
jgi:hypothetical protein